MTRRTRNADSIQIGGATTGQQENNIEVIHVSDKAGQQIRTSDKQHVGQGNLGVLFPNACTIHLSRLIQIGRNVHQNTSCHQHQVRDTDPDVDQNDRNSCPSLVCPEWQSRLNPTPLHKKAVYDTIGGKHLGNVQQ